MAVEFRVLGPVEVVVDGRPVDPGHLRQRCVLAVLLAEAGRPVSPDRLADQAWSGGLPRQSREPLYGYVSRLRRVLAASGLTIDRTPAGYVLAVDEQRIDLHRFRHLVTQARGADDTVRAETLFGQALRLWRGEAFAGLDTPLLTSLRTTLDAERRAAERDHTDLLLRHGRHSELPAPLAAQAMHHPLDERLTGQLMLALHRAGRTADALDTYERVRQRLAEELGADPSPALRELHWRILTADPALRPEDPRPASTAGQIVVPRQLPAAPRSFIGREDHLAALTATLDEGTGVISSIGGAGGIGKTWLALVWAHRHLDRFPDGQLFADLRGFSPDDRPADPAVAMRGFLDTLGVAPGRVPADPEAQAALFRSLVTGKRMLIVLDNAATTDQVTPLLPGGDFCTVLVTSRNRLPGLVTAHDAHHLALDVLPDRECHTLLAGRLGTRRVAAEPEAVAELIRLCGGYPLALGIVTARAHTCPGVPLAEIAADLHESGLDALATDEPAASLPAVLSWSDRVLPLDQQTAFALLGLAPGPDIGLPAAAALTGLPPVRTAHMLRSLQQKSLISQYVEGRFQLHDLIRRHAADTANRRLTDFEREAALRRLADFFLHTAHAADRLLNPQRPTIRLDPPAPGIRPHLLSDERGALAWFDAERPNLLATHHLSTARGWHQTAWQLAWTLTMYHYRRGYLHDNLELWQTAADLAEHLEPDPLVWAHIQRYLGLAHADLGLHQEAIGLFEQAQAGSERCDDVVGEAFTHRALAIAWEGLGEYRRALDHSTRALERFEGLGRPVWQAYELNAVGWYAALLGDYSRAREHCTEALVLHRRNGDLLGAADALDSLGYVDHHSDRHSQAISRYRQALTIYRDHDHPHGVASTLEELGGVYAAIGEHDQARTAWLEALELCRRQGRSSDHDRISHRLRAGRK